MRQVIGKKVGFIGLGSMGKPMAINILKAGFPVIAYDVRKEPLVEIGKLGAKVARSANEVGNSSDTVMVMVSDYTQVKEVVFPPEGALAGMKRGAVLIIMSTIAPREVEKVHEEARRVGVALIDAPVSGGRLKAEDGSLTIMVGADAEVLKHNEDVLRAVGKHIYHMGNVGQGQAMKMVNQLLVMANIVGLAEGLMMARKLNVNLRLAVDVLSNSASDSFVLRMFAPKMMAGDFTTQAAINILKKDLRIIIETGMELDAPLLVSNVCYHVCRIAESRGMGKEDTAALIKVYEEYAGVRLGDCNQ